jgi:uncharacterized protein
MRATRRPVWRALVIGDGPGHQAQQTGAERQALALASALLKLGSQRPVDAPAAAASGWNVRAESLTAVRHPMPRLFRPLPGGLAQLSATRLAGVAFMCLPPGAARRAVPPGLVAGSALPPPYNAEGNFSNTLILAAGSAASAPALVARDRLLGSRLIQVLHPRRAVDQFEVVVTPAHDFAPGADVPDNVVTTAGSLHDISRERLAAHASEHPCEDVLALPSPRITVLLGGPRGLRSRLYTWSDAGASHMASQAASHAGAAGSVVVTVSRRTPAAFALRLQRQLVSRLGTARVLYDDGTRRARYLYLLATSDALVVTADSVNMLSEAAASPARLLVAGSSGSRRLDRFCKHLVDSGRAEVLGRAADGTRRRGVGPAGGDSVVEVDQVAAAVWRRLTV